MSLLLYTILERVSQSWKVLWHWGGLKGLAFFLPEMWIFLACSTAVTKWKEQSLHWIDVNRETAAWMQDTAWHLVPAFDLLCFKYQNRLWSYICASVDVTFSVPFMWRQGECCSWESGCKKKENLPINGSIEFIFYKPCSQVRQRYVIRRVFQPRILNVKIKDVLPVKALVPPHDLQNGLLWCKMWVNYCKWTKHSKICGMVL